MSNSYQDIVTQSWTTYTTTQAKYRTKDYIALLSPLYATLSQLLGDVDAVVKDLGASRPPGDKALKNAESLFTKLQSTIANMADVFKTFTDMDAVAVNKAASLDQSKLRKVYEGVEKEDAALSTAFATSVFNAQEDAARAMSVFAPG